MVALVIVVGAGCAADYFFNAEKIYKGVSVGSVDLSGKTLVEAEAAIDEAYAERLFAGRAIVYASEDLVGKVDVATELLEEEALADQISLETARENKQVWVVDAESMGASVATKDLVAQAYAVGREEGGLLARLGALVFGKELGVYCNFHPEEFDALVLDIDETLGMPRYDANIAIEDGVAVVKPGQDGNCLDQERFAAQLSDALLLSDTLDATLVAKVAPSAMRIVDEQAQAACDYVNSILGTQVSFAYDGEGWGVTKTALASWITTEVVSQGKGYALNLLIDQEAAKPSIVSFSNEFIGKRDVAVDFEKSGGQINVLTDGGVELPYVAGALQAIDEALFGAYRETVGLKHDPSLTKNTYIAEDLSMIQVAIEHGKAPKQLSFDEAFDQGLIVPVSSYTTTYYNNESTQNRVHNIHRAADIITDAIVQSGGGTWSFNDRAGFCGPDQGFLGAGVIIDGEIQDAVGGGICQVATTVFNAVYEGGYGIERRHAHSLHMDAYPDGRDAAVSYDDLDLVWRNDSASDVLMRCSYTDNTLTVTLFSVDPGYEVTHVDGDWKKTKDYATKKVVDENLYSGQSYVETKGTDAMQFAVFRTVTDADGQVIYEDSFYSSYGSVTEVVRVAPDYKETEAASSKSTS